MKSLIMIALCICSRPVEVKITPFRTDAELHAVCRPLPGNLEDYETRCRERLMRDEVMRRSAELHARSVCADPSMPHECEKLRAALVTP